MLKVAMSSIAMLAILVGAAFADDKKADTSKAANTVHAMFVKADVAKNTLTFATTDKTGKTVETTMELAKDAKILNKADKPETLAAFVKDIQNEKNKAILVMEDRQGKQIVEVKWQPNKS